MNRMTLPDNFDGILPFTFGILGASYNTKDLNTHMTSDCHLAATLRLIRKVSLCSNHSNHSCCRIELLQLHTLVVRIFPVLERRQSYPIDGITPPRRSTSSPTSLNKLVLGFQFYAIPFRIAQLTVFTLLTRASCFKTVSLVQRPTSCPKRPRCNVKKLWWPTEQGSSETIFYFELISNSWRMNHRCQLSVEIHPERYWLALAI